MTDKVGDALGSVVSTVLSPISALMPGQPNMKLPQKKTMPAPDDKEIQEARRRQIAKQMARGGRVSTILTDGNKDTLG